MVSTWVYFAAAAVIAIVAFLLGQLVPGLGVVFVGLATTLWVAFSVSRQRKRLAVTPSARSGNDNPN